MTTKLHSQDKYQLLSETRGEHKTLFFLTAGETPSISGLHASQILEPATFLSKKGHVVHWVAAVPFISFIKNMVFGRNELQKIRNKCKELNIKFVLVFTIWSFNGVLLFPIRKYLIKRTALRVYRKIRAYIGESTVIHGRSYYATQMALYLDQAIDFRVNSLVSFDMRSLAPGEMPLTRGWLGCVYYGFYKKWEYELISRSDVSFLPLKSGCKQLKKETGKDVKYAPIQGFDREVGYQPDFDERWLNRIAGYSGSFGAYQDPELLKEMLGQIEGVNHLFATMPNESLRNYQCAIFPFSEMSQYYRKLLFLTIPGRKVDCDYFKTLNMRTNLFSTKASEALSLGVPLFVSSHLTELVDFIREHDCGIIYDPQERKIVHPAKLNLNDRDFWRELTENAFSAGKEFTRRNVAQVYIDNWDRVFEAKAM